MAPTVIAASSRQIPDLEQSPFGAMRRCGAGAVGCALHARHASIEEENRQAPPLGGRGPRLRAGQRTNARPRLRR